MPKVGLILLCISHMLRWSNSANILGVFPMASYSHHILGRRLMLELAERGHNVTVIDVYSEKDVPDNYKQIIITGLVEATDEDWKADLMESGNGIFKNFTLFQIFTTGMVKQIFSHPNFLEFVHNSDNSFDLVIVEQFVFDAIKVLGHHFNAPMIALSTIGANNMVNSLTGNPAIPSYLPHFSSPYTSLMNFWQRSYNLFLHIWSSFCLELWLMPKANQIVQQYFPEAPSIAELNNKVSLVLLNAHVSVSQPLPLTPNMIEIGGYHVTPPKKLPKDLQEFFDNATEGVIYFNMGSNLRSKDLPEAKRNVILKAFANVKEQILWKWEDDVLPGQSENIKLAKWLPQQDILAHPNLKLFITHGGILSVIEAVYHGVPLLGIPIFGDQTRNMVNAVASGYALMLSLEQLEEKTFAATLSELLYNSSYRRNAQKRSRIMHDQPMKPLDTAIYWIEYVIRHRGATHFRCATLELTWYQLYMIDIPVFAILVVIAVIYLIYTLVQKLCTIKTVKKMYQQKKKN